MRKVTVAAAQMACSASIDENISKAENLIRQAADRGAQIILLQELFETPYFCQAEKFEYYKLANEVQDNKGVQHFGALARELKVVLPISFYERKNLAYYNSVAVIDADGTVLGVYRKTHIPTGPGYQEKFYFNPGDTGFKVWKTQYGSIGVGICWDQWFPESARCMALMGAEMLFYPTAIGSEPDEPEVDSKDHWQRCMQGHAAANIMPVIAANRIGSETICSSTIDFYGSSFITDSVGKIIAEADRTSEMIITAEFDLEAIEEQRISWTVFRDRRPECYQAIVSNDGIR
ncbi:MAG: N-carbamoylputrescine amidase [Syntrophomonadaceae bacterium]|nr:N-carbamoylputrescine amidase [Syntrophomonadaceae bacterium]